MTNNLSTDRHFAANPSLRFQKALHILQQSILAVPSFQQLHVWLWPLPDNNPSLLLYQQMIAFPGLFLVERTACQIFVLKIKCIIFLCQADLLFKLKMVLPLSPYSWGVLNMADVNIPGM